MLAHHGIRCGLGAAFAERPLWFQATVARVILRYSVATVSGLFCISASGSLFIVLCFAQVLISTLGESKETSTAVNERVKAAEEAAVEPVAQKDVWARARGEAW